MRITQNGGIAFAGATNYGTSGQYLKSNGDAAPTWVTPAAGGVTSLNGQTGAITNTSVNAIGSYVFVYTGIAASFGGTTAGSNLTYADASFVSTSMGCTGTWQNMGAQVNGGNSFRQLFVRIS